ncbi:MAG: extracellular solute-binding protein [Chloroflexota bacterium]|nr:extracellular solute-binding protein [Chloroflexota bacterium]
MKQRSKLFMVLAAIMMLAMVFAACGGTVEKPAPAEEAAPAEEPAPAEETAATEEMLGPDGVPYAGLDKDLSGITIRMANIGGQPYEAMYDSIKTFEEVTGANVEIVFLGDGFEIDRYLKTNYAANTVDFDVAWNHTSFMSQFTNFVEDLNQYFTPEELAAFSPAIMESANIDGALQLIPRHADISGMHYRTDLFSDPDLQAKFEADYGYPLAPPTTLDEMYDMAEFFVGEGVIQYGTEFAGKEEALAGRYYEVLVANGGNYFDENLQPVFDSEAGKMSAQWMKDLYDNGLIPADTTNLLWPEVAQNFCDSNVAFYLEWYGWYSYFQDPDSCSVAGKFDIARGPVGAGDIHTGWAGAHAFSIPKAAENKEAAAQLVKFLSSQQVAYDEGKLGLLPVRDDVWEMIIADAAQSDVPLDKTRLEVAQTQIAEDFFTPPLFADWISFTNLWYPQLQSIILGDVSVDKGLAQAVEETRSMMEDFGYYEAGAQQETLESPDIGAGADDLGELAYAGLNIDLSGQTIRMANIGGQPYEALYDSIKKFEKETGANVEIVFLGDGFEIDRYLKTNYAANTVDFDVAWNHTSFMSQFTNFVEDLNQYFTPEELAAFSPAIMESANIDGALQLIPRHADISGMHYRTDLFSDPDLQAKFEADYGYPLAPPTTLDEMYDMAEFFVGEGVIQYGTEFAGKEEALAGRYYEVLVANGGNYFDENLQPIFDSEAGKMSAQWMKDLYDNGLIPADTTNLLWPEVAQNFCDSNVAFYLEWYGWYSYFQDPDSCSVAGKFDIARGPVGAGDIHTGWAGAHAFSIPKSAENKEGAVQLVKFLSSEAVAYDEAKLGLLPVRDDVWVRIITDAEVSDVPLDKTRLEVAQTQIAEDFFTPPLFADWISFTNLWYPQLQSIILGDVSVEDGLNQAIEDTREMLTDFGYY